MTDTDVKIVAKRPLGFTDRVTHYCPGCTHGVAHRLIAEVLEEMGELKNTIDRAVVLARSETLDVPDLGDADREQPAAAPVSGWLDGDLPSAVARLETEMIRRALSACADNRTEAARRLGINRQLLYTKIERYGLDGEERPDP